MKSSIAKTATGWEGNSRLKLNNGMVLRIRTAKREAGDVRTTAIVMRVEGSAGYLAETHTSHDFATAIGQSHGKATEKLVRTMHGMAGDMLPLLIADISDHYGAVIKVIEDE